MIAETSFLDAFSVFSLAVLIALAAGAVGLAFIEDQNRTRSLAALSSGLEQLALAQAGIRGTIRDTGDAEKTPLTFEVEAFVLALRMARVNMPLSHAEAIASAMLADTVLASDLVKRANGLAKGKTDLSEVASSFNKARALLGSVPASALEDAERHDQLSKLPSTRTATEVLAYLHRANVAESAIPLGASPPGLRTAG